MDFISLSSFFNSPCPNTHSFCHVFDQFSLFFVCFFTCSCPHQLSVGLRFSVQRLEDAGPKISFELQIHRWHTHQQSCSTPPPQPSSLFLSLSYTHKELFVFHLIHVNTFRVCPDHVAVCGLMKLTADAEKYRWPRGAPDRRQALHKMPTVCLIALFSISHIARCRCLTFAIPLLGEFLSESSEPENPALLWVHLEFWFCLHCIKASLEIIKSVCSFYSSFILTVWMSPQLQQR